MGARERTTEAPRARGRLERKLSVPSTDEAHLCAMFEDMASRSGRFNPIFPSARHANLYRFFPLKRSRNEVMRKWIEQKEAAAGARQLRVQFSRASFAAACRTSLPPKSLIFPESAITRF